MGRPDAIEDSWQPKLPSEMVLPPGSHTPPGYLAACSSLSQLAKYARNHVYKKPFLSGQRLEMKVVKEVISSLQEWADALPSHLKISHKIAPRVFYRPIAVLHLRYHSIRLLVTRPFLLYDVMRQKTMEDSGNTRGLEPLSSLCVGSAESMLSILQEMVTENTFSRMIALDFLFALDVLQVLLSAFALAKAENELTNIRKCLEILQVMGSAGYGNNMLSEVIFELVQWGIIPENSEPPHAVQNGDPLMSGFDAVDQIYNLLFETSDSAINSNSFPIFSGSDLPAQPGAALRQFEPHDTSLS